mgnify:CR=1 FL=1
MRRRQPAPAVPSPSSPRSARSGAAKGAAARPLLQRPNGRFSVAQGRRGARATYSVRQRAAGRRERPTARAAPDPAGRAAGQRSPTRSQDRAAPLGPAHRPVAVRRPAHVRPEARSDQANRRPGEPAGRRRPAGRAGRDGYAAPRHVAEPRHARRPRWSPARQPGAAPLRAESAPVDPGRPRARTQPAPAHRDPAGWPDRPPGVAATREG